MADAEPLPLPILDPRNEDALVEQALIHTYNASGGKLNDFSSSSVARSLLEGQAFAGAELLFYLNRLPLAIVLQYLRITGVERRLGTKAQVTLTFTLRAVLAAPYTIPQGFQVLGGRYSYFTDSILVIPEGAISGQVTATAAEVGTRYNLPAYEIDAFTQPLAFLSAVTNEEAASGGTDEEPLDEAIARGLAEIRRRNLVTASDYEEEAVSILGEGSVAKAIGLLAGDKVSYQLGAVHLFALNASGEVPNNAQLTTLQQEMNDRIQIGTQLYVSAIDLVLIDVEVVAQLVDGEDPNSVAEELWAALREYLAPTAFQPGESLLLNEVEFALRLTGRVEYIQAVTLNDQATNLPMPHPYSLPKANAIYCKLVDSVGETHSVILADGDPQFISYL